MRLEVAKLLQPALESRNTCTRVSKTQLPIICINSFKRSIAIPGKIVECYHSSSIGPTRQRQLIVSLKVSQSLFSNRAELTGGRSGKIAEIPQPVLNGSQIWISRIYLSKSRTGCTQNRQHQSQRQQTDISLTR